jgi:hypothetical protein
MPMLPITAPKFIVCLMGSIPMSFCLASRWPACEVATHATATRFTSVQEATERAARHWTADQFTIKQVNK